MPRITLNREIADRAENIARQTLLMEARYSIVTPTMIGDFTGDTYKIIEASDKRGATLTGLPTAQAIIGKARWLTRVAIATATRAKTHREAEQAGSITLNLPGGKHLKLGIVEYLFGSSAKRWRGILSVEVQPLPREGNKFYFINLNRKEINLYRAILEARNIYSSNHFYEFGTTWKLSRKGRYVAGPRKPWGNNRYNAILAVGSQIYTLEEPITEESITFFPKSTNNERLKLVDPLSERSILEGFILKIFLDKLRLGWVDEKDRNRADEAVRLGILALIAVPILLGLGKAGNRGFGHFKLEKETVDFALAIINLDDIIEAVSSNDTRKIISMLYKMSRSATGATGEFTIDWKNSLIPILPVGDLTDQFVAKVDTSSKTEQIEQVLDLIGFAATKYAWKSVALGTKSPKIIAKELGKEYHTWPLGLPRRGEFGQRPTGYMLEDSIEGRRQSYVIAYTIDGKNVDVIGFPSGDLIELHEKLIFHSIHVKIIVREIRKCIKITGWRRKIKYGSKQNDCNAVKKILTAFENFVKVLEIYRP